MGTFRIVNLGTHLSLKVRRLAIPSQILCPWTPETKRDGTKFIQVYLLLGESMDVLHLPAKWMSYLLQKYIFRELSSLSGTLAKTLSCTMRVVFLQPCELSVLSQALRQEHSYLIAASRVSLQLLDLKWDVRSCADLQEHASPLLIPPILRGDYCWPFFSFPVSGLVPCASRLNRPWTVVTVWMTSWGIQMTRAQPNQIHSPLPRQ